MIEGCKAGDRHAMDFLYRKFFNKMLGIVYTNIPDKSLAYDILHDGFIVIFSHISELKDPDKLEAWMGRIMRNISVKSKKIKGQSIILAEDLFEQASESMEDLLSYSEILDMVNRLPEGYGKIFRLSFFENKSHLEIARLLGIAPHSSSSQLYRAKSLLRKMIGTLLREKGYWCIMILSMVIPFVLYFTHDDSTDECAGVLNDKNTKDLRPVKTINEHISNTNTCRVENGNPSIYSDEEIGKADNKGSVSAYIMEDTATLVSDEEDLSDQSLCEGLPEVKKYQDSSCGDSDDVRPDHLLDANDYLLRSIKRKKLFSVSVESGIKRSTRVYGSGVPDFICSTTPLDSTVIYHLPLSFSILTQSRIDHNCYIESGLSYTYRQTEEKVHYSFGSENKKSETHFIGIPLKAKYNVYESSNMEIYTSVGMKVDFPINAVKIPVQWSVNGSVGLEYIISPKVGLFVEPSLQYHLNSPESSILLYRNPLEVTIPFGVRFNW